MFSLGRCRRLGERHNNMTEENNKINVLRNMVSNPVDCCFHVDRRALMFALRHYGLIFMYVM
jgi:hypothetical protein